MTKKAAWILVLLVALIAVSASAAFAATLTRPSQAFHAPVQGLSAGGNVTVATLRGFSGGRYKQAHVKTDRFTHCHLEEDAPAY